MTDSASTVHEAVANVSVVSPIVGTVTGVVGGPRATLGYQAGLEDGVTRSKRIEVTRPPRR